jgi:hypothetical protein
MSRRRLLHLLAAVAGFAVPAAATHADDAADPVRTRAALTALLAAANDAIPANSSCAGDYGQPGRPTVKDLLGVELAALHGGDNVVSGECRPDGRCQLTIRHASGDDVSAAEIRFAIHHGKAQASTLACVITP